MKNKSARVLFYLLFCIFCIESVVAQNLPSLIPYRKGNKWGFANSTKKIIIEPEYDEVNFFSQGLAAVRKDNTWTFINSNGKKVGAHKFHLVNDFNEKGQAKVSIIKKRTKKEGNPTKSKECNKALKEIEDPRLTHEFKDVIIKSSPCIIEQFYIINKKGKRIIRLDNETSYPNGKRNYYSVKKGFRWVKKIIVQDTTSGNKNKEFQLRHKAVEGHCAVMKNEKWGIADTTGKVIVELKYDYVTDFSEGIAIAQLGEKYFGFDHSGKELFMYDKGFLIGECHEGMILAKEVKKVDAPPFVYNEFYGYVGKDGSYKIRPNFKTASPFYKKYAIVKDFTDSKFYFITTSGEKIANKNNWFMPVPCCNDDLDSLGNIIQENGLFKIENRTHADPNTITEDNAGFQFKRIFGFINADGTEVIPVIYENAGRFHNNICKVIINNKAGLIDAAGNKLTEIKYDLLQVPTQYDCPNMVESSYHTLLDHFSADYLWNKGLVKVIIDGKAGLVDIYGREYFED